MRKVRVTAPPTGANLGPGFDVLGVAYKGIEGDEVSARRTDDFRGVRLIGVINNPGLPINSQNVAQAAGQYVLDASGEELGIELILDKRMGIGTGMGSSASSSVAAAVAVNELLEKPFPRYHQKMLEAVVHGEDVATKGSPHADNVLTSLFGGFVFVYDLLTYRHEKFEAGNSFHFAITSPTNLTVNTGDARRALQSAPYDTKGLVRVTAFLLKNYLRGEINLNLLDLHKLVKEGGSEETIREYLKGAMYLMEGIKNNNPETLGLGTMMDKIITPIRAQFITEYYDVRDAALAAGAYGFTISGSGPTVLGGADNNGKAHNVGDAFRRAFERNGIQSKTYISQVDNHGARII